MPSVPVRRARLSFLEVPAATKMSLERSRMSMLNDERRRVTFQQVELGYSENAVQEEARRCLRCDVYIRCGTCMDCARKKSARRYAEITPPNMVKNDPDALIEVSLDGEGTHRFPQDCLRRTN